MILQSVVKYLGGREGVLHCFQKSGIIGLTVPSDTFFVS